MSRHHYSQRRQCKAERERKKTFNRLFTIQWNTSLILFLMACMACSVTQSHYYLLIDEDNIIHTEGIIKTKKHLDVWNPKVNGWYVHFEYSYGTMVVKSSRKVSEQEYARLSIGSSIDVKINRRMPKMCAVSFKSDSNISINDLYY